MKMICLILSVLAATVAGEQLPLTQPRGYQIQTPAVPFTAEEILSQPSQQYLTPDAFAVASSPTVPAQLYEEPSAVAAPAQLYQEPSAVAAPAQLYQEPSAVAAPAQLYEEPSAVAAPAQLYQEPSAVAAPAQLYQEPSAVAAPAQLYEEPSAVAAPAQLYQEPSAVAAPAQLYEEPSAVAAPAQLYEEPSAVAAPASAPSQGYQQPAQTYAAPEYQAPAQYDFAYTVSAFDPVGNKVDFGHNEQRNDAYTAGSYYVLLPDTRLMRVEYYSDETGFHPTYTYEGEAVYPQAYAAAVAAAPVQQPSQLYSQPGRK